MAREVEGVVTIVQEGRFQLVDQGGAGHLFILGHGAPAETAQLAPLQRSQARVLVRYTDAPDLIGNVAISLVRLP